MKYTARVQGIPAEHFSSLKAARAWVRECYSRGMNRGESRRYTIELNNVVDGYVDGYEPNFADYGFVINGRLYASK